MIFMNPLGVSTGLTLPTRIRTAISTISTTSPIVPAVLPEDIPRLTAELICRLRSENRTESEIVDIIRKTFLGINDSVIVGATAVANQTCPLALTPVTPVQDLTLPPPRPAPLPRPQPDTDDTQPDPFTPDEPTVIVFPETPPSTRQGGVSNLAIFGGIAVGVIAIGLIASAAAGKG